jgi:replicative DNA helicase
MPTDSPTSNLNAAPAQKSGDENRVLIERVVLGTAMESPTDLDALRTAGVDQEWFYDLRHATIWTTIVDAADGGSPTTPIAITERLVRNGVLAAIGDNAYVFTLYQTSDPGRGTWYAKQLAERHQQRKVGEAAAKLNQSLSSDEFDPDRIADLAGRITEAATLNLGSNSDDAVRIDSAVDEYLANYLKEDTVDAIQTPWVDINEMLASHGFERGQVVTVGGSTGMGKSIALTNLAREIGIGQFRPTVMFTMEMTVEAVTWRILADLAGVEERSIRRRELSDLEIAKVESARERLQNAPLWIISGPQTVSEMRRTVDRLSREYGEIHTVVIDYIQIIKLVDRTHGQQVAIADNMKAIKEWALEGPYLIIAAAQVNRNPNSRPDRRPTLSDLRESGEIENSSDIVILLHREDYYDSESPRTGEVDFILAKQRGGYTGTVTLAAQLHLTRFVSMALPE